MKPKRIQRRRTGGWVNPPNSVFVGRPYLWGNPFFHDKDPGRNVELYRDALLGQTGWTVNRLEQWIGHFYDNPRIDDLRAAAIKHLRGKNLVCWCPLNQPCHADVLLELVNDPG